MKEEKEIREKLEEARKKLDTIKKLKKRATKASDIYPLVEEYLKIRCSSENKDKSAKILRGYSQDFFLLVLDEEIENLELFGKALNWVLEIEDE